MTVKEAAALIGINAASLRQAIRNGSINAMKIPTMGGYRYEIDRKDAKQYRDNPPDPRGRPRGK